MNSVNKAGPAGGSDPRLAIRALALDVVCVLVFCTLGRYNHGEALHPGGITETAWPFLAGAGVGWVLARAWRNPAALVPAGLVVWVCTVAVGMLLRLASGQTAETSFVIVATAVTAALLLGWRAVAKVIAARR